MSKKSPLRGPFDNEHSKQAEKLLKAEHQHRYDIYWSLWRQFSWKKSLLVICKILGLFLSTLNADDKCSHLNGDTLLKHFQMQLSQKQKKIFPIFSSILEIFIQF